MARNLLPDMLFEIFRRCLPSDLSNASVATSSVNLSQVCRSWRSVALENTSLWASLTLRHDGIGDVHLLKARDAWMLWLERSANASLTVDIYVDKLLDGEEEEAFAEIVEVTFAEQHRWRDIRVWCNSFKAANPSRPLRLATSPHLQALLLRNHMPLSALPGCSQGEIILDLSNHVQNIRTLSLRGVPSLSPIVGFMPSLYSLDIQAHSGAGPRTSSSPTLTTQDLFKILSSAPSLTHLSTSLIFTTSETTFPTAIILSHLQSIDLTVCGFAEQFFGVLTCPALEEFRISFLDEQAKSRDTWTAIADLIARSRSPLRHLDICCGAILDSALRREDELLSVLKHAPSLASLSLKGQYISDKFISALIIEPDPLACNICPGLELITIACKCVHNVTAECVANMIRSRYWTFEGERAAVPLREVVLDLQGLELVVNVPSMRVSTSIGISLGLSKWSSLF